jgi:hypothetical protein
MVAALAAAAPHAAKIAGPIAKAAAFAFRRAHLTH